MQSVEIKPLLLDISDVTLRVTHEEFERLCQNNPDLRLELTTTGELVTMAPAGFESSERNANLIIDVGVWNRQTKQVDMLPSPKGTGILVHGSQRITCSL